MNPEQPRQQNIGTDQPAPQVTDNPFLIQPTPKKPLDKKSITIVAILSVLGVIALGVVLVTLLISSATNLANDYRNLAATQVSLLDEPLKDLEPQTVLNERDLDKPAADIAVSRQSKPRLQTIILVGDWSKRYQETSLLQKTINQHYVEIDTYQTKLSEMIAFDDTINDVLRLEDDLDSPKISNNPLSLRTTSGTYQDYVSRIEKQTVPTEMTAIKKKIVDVFKSKVTIYSVWAKQLEAKDKKAQPSAIKKLKSQKNKLTPLVADKTYAEALDPSYKNIITQQASIEKQLTQ